MTSRQRLGAQIQGVFPANGHRQERGRPVPARAAGHPDADHRVADLQPAAHELLSNLVYGGQAAFLSD
jgi:hypothetical protein